MSLLQKSSIVCETSEDTYGSTHTGGETGNSSTKSDPTSPDEVNVDFLNDNISDFADDGDVSVGLKERLTSRLTPGMAFVVALGILAIGIVLFAIYSDSTPSSLYSIGILLIMVFFAHISHGIILVAIHRSKATSAESLGFSKSTIELSTSTYGKHVPEYENLVLTRSSEEEDYKPQHQFSSSHQAKSPDFAFVYMISFIRLFFSITSIVTNCLGIALSVTVYKSMQCDSCELVIGLTVLADLLVGVPSIVLTVLSVVDYLSLIAFINSTAFKQLECKHLPKKI